MNDPVVNLPRYPGARPFSDDPVSRKVFFGRDEEGRRLTDQILANRLTVLYARSGAGKSSLLNAAVAPALRTLGYAPLITRVNDIASGPTGSVINGALRHARQQGFEVTNLSDGTLSSMLAGTEFWQGDLLLRPVLIVDQFEELFTLHTAAKQNEFLNQLAEVVNGQAKAALVVLALRESYVTWLEDAAGHLPRILDQRFRLTALKPENAREALLRPAEVEDAALASPPFRFDPKAADKVLTYLETLTVNARDANARRIEPFFLQLICANLEGVAAKRQTGGGSFVVLTEDDIGGHRELDMLLRNFFRAAIESVGRGRIRRRVLRLCVNELISPDGRRVSLSDQEIMERVRVPVATLDALVTARVVRSESRAESRYFELSHDALIEPILSLQRARMTVLFWIGAIFLLIGALFGILVMAMGIVVLSRAFQRDFGAGEVLGFITIFVAFIAIALGVRQGLRIILLRRRKFRVHREFQGPFV